MNFLTRTIYVPVRMLYHSPRGLSRSQIQTLSTQTFQRSVFKVRFLNASNFWLGRRIGRVLLHDNSLYRGRQPQPGGCINRYLSAFPGIVESSPRRSPLERSDCRIVDMAIIMPPFSQICMIHVGLLMDLCIFFCARRRLGEPRHMWARRAPRSGWLPH